MTIKQGYVVFFKWLLSLTNLNWEVEVAKYEDKDI